MQYKFIKFGPEGFPLFYYCEQIYPPDIITDDGTGETISEKKNPDIPNDAVPVTDEQWQAAQSMNLWRASDGSLTSPPVPEPVEPVPVVTILPAVALWERLTEAEADQVNEAMATQPIRTQRIFTTASTFHSDHELWPLLEQMATELFGAERAAELLKA